MAKEKNHVVYVDSSFGRSIGFVSEHFKGAFTVKTPARKGFRRGHVPAKNYFQHGSFLWLDQGRNRVVLSNVIEREHTLFGLPELMVCIAQSGYDCVLYADIAKPAPEVRAPYLFRIGEEEIAGRRTRVMTMTPEDVEEHLVPFVEERKKFSRDTVIDLAKRSDMSRQEAVGLIRHAWNILEPKKPLQQLDLVSDQDLFERVGAAQNIIINYYCGDDVSAVTPNPHIGEVLVKNVNGKTRHLTYGPDPVGAGLCWTLLHPPTAAEAEPRPVQA